MRAILCRSYGLPDTLTMEDVPVPEPGPGQVLVEIAASSVTFVDLLTIADKYQFRRTPPFIPGGTIGGTVRCLGDGVLGLAQGDRVLGTVTTGSYAEYAVAKASALSKVPAEIDLPTAVAAVGSYATSLYALRDRGNLKPGDNLLVLGAGGGVGSAAVELGKLMGARVTAAASSTEKLELARRLGADTIVQYPTALDGRESQKALADQFKTIAPKGFDVIYDPIGGDYTEPALRAIAWDGRYLVIGFAAGSIPRIPINLLLLKSGAMVGVFLGAYAEREPGRAKENLGLLMDWLANGTIKPPAPLLRPLTAAAEALNMIAARQTSAKIVLVP